MRKTNKAPVDQIGGAKGPYQYISGQGRGGLGRQAALSGTSRQLMSPHTKSPALAGNDVDLREEVTHHRSLRYPQYLEAPPRNDRPRQ